MSIDSAKLKLEQSESPNAAASDRQEEEDPASYHQQYCRLLLCNVVLTTQLKELLNDRTELQNKLQRLEKRIDDLGDGTNGTNEQRKKRIRRIASEIQRHYKCQVENCQKSYGSEGSLNQHIKLKHPQLFDSIKNNTTLEINERFDEDEESYR